MLYRVHQTKYHTNMTWIAPYSSFVLEQNDTIHSGNYQYFIIAD